MSVATIELTTAEWQALRESASQASGGVVPWAGPEPTLFSTLELTVTIAGDRVATFSGQVVNIFGSQVALMFDPPALVAIESGTAQRAPTPSSGTPSPGSQLRKRDAAPSKPSGRERVGKDSPVWKRYQELTRTEKMKLARSGNEAERRAVLKDRDSSIHHFVLSNPNMKPKELAALVRGGAVSGAFLKKLCERHDFLSNRSVAEALVLNPQTPVDVAIRLVGRIPLELARRIARSTTYRPQVVNAAKKRVLNR